MMSGDAERVSRMEWIGGRPTCGRRGSRCTILDSRRGTHARLRFPFGSVRHRDLLHRGPQTSLALRQVHNSRIRSLIRTRRAGTRKSTQIPSHIYVLLWLPRDWHAHWELIDFLILFRERIRSIWANWHKSNTCWGVIFFFYTFLMYLLSYYILERLFYGLITCLINYSVLFDQLFYTCNLTVRLKAAYY